ncbi:hypothetical protein ABFV57_31400, partial [Pseudomonas neuropathica]|uniref:hypothetical protein n=1 Tax=Pseudomonas neuropathica TaxID=2730425 RepID=UPI0034D611AA
STERLLGALKIITRSKKKDNWPKLEAPHGDILIKLALTPTLPIKDRVDHVMVIANTPEKPPYFALRFTHLEQTVRSTKNQKQWVAFLETILH